MYGKIKGPPVLGTEMYKIYGNIPRHALLDQENNGHSDEVGSFERTNNEEDVTENMNTRKNHRRLAAVNT